MKKLPLLLITFLLCACNRVGYISTVTDSFGIQSDFPTEAGESSKQETETTSADTSDTVDAITSYVFDSTSDTETNAETSTLHNPDTETTTETSTSHSSGTLTVTYLTEKVKRGNTATLSIKGSEGTVYSIAVYYSTTVSTAKGLEPKTAEADGSVSWNWKVGSRTKAGKHRIVISGGGESLTLYFTTE